MKWSIWLDINTSSNHYSHAVYEIRLLNAKGKRISINRFLGVDKEAILAIGMTTNMERRRKQFISGLVNCQGHSEGNLLYLLEKYSKFNSKYKKLKYQYRFFKINSKANTKRQERRLIKDYVKQYGEVPPVNSAIPDRLS